MNELNIFDVSALVHTGAASKFFRENKNYGFPVGGINYLMRQVCNCLVLRDPVVLCFDSPTFRKRLMPGYKAGRPGHPEVTSQIQFVYESLLGCGFRCEKYDGYEADDIVDWATKKYVGKYGTVVIVGNDHDLCHSVQNGVRFKSIDPNTSCIYEGNFEESVDSTYTKFNTISAKKAICGCTSDRIPAMKLQCGKSAKEVYSLFIHFFSDHNFPFSYAATTDSRYLMAFANSCGFFTKDERVELIKRIKMVYPAPCPEGVDIVPVNFIDIDLDKFAKFLSMTNDYDSLKCIGHRKVTLDDGDKQFLRDRGRKLVTGEYAADNNMQVECQVSTKMLDLSSFTKEF